MSFVAFIDLYWSLFCFFLLFSGLQRPLARFLMAIPLLQRLHASAGFRFIFSSCSCAFLLSFLSQISHLRFSAPFRSAGFLQIMESQRVMYPVEVWNCNTGTCLKIIVLFTHERSHGKPTTLCLKLMDHFYIFLLESMNFCAHPVGRRISPRARHAWYQENHSIHQTMKMLTLKRTG